MRHARHGQSMVEFALFVTILILLLSSLFDLGVMLSAHLAVTTAARQSALAAASAGKDASADCSALAAIQLATNGHTGLTITQIIIYQSGGDGAPVGGPGSTGFADVYAGNPGCSNPATAPAAAVSNWLPMQRNTCFLAPDALGIEIDYTYSWQTAVFALGPLHVSDHVVVRVAPDPASQNCA